MHETFRDKGFEILAFPCGQFNNQEFDTAKEIEAFGRGKMGAEFAIFQKCDVNGENAIPLFRYLRRKSELYNEKEGRSKQIPWNFTKFLVTNDGQDIKFIHPFTENKEVIREIENAMAMEEERLGPLTSSTHVDER